MKERTTATANIRTQRFVVVVSVVLFCTKILAFYLTNSVAILTDALESTVNVVTGFIGLYSLSVAARPRDENHPYGHGKAELISASFEGLLILIAGVVIIYESIINLIHQHPIRELDTGMILIAGTALINFATGWYCIRIGEKNHSVALVASGKHLQSDTWTTVGIIVGLLLIRFTGIQWIDSAVAILFGGMIIIEGYKIIRTTISGIMDEADMELLRQMIEMLNRNKRDTWIDLHNLRTIKYGSILHVDCHITLPWYFNVREAHEEVEALEALIRNQFPHSIEMFVHADACQPPESCAICPVANCPERQAAFSARLAWTLQNITTNERHRMA